MANANNPPAGSPLQDLMQCVIVRPEPPGRFTAQAVMAPDVTATADTEHAAAEQVRLALAALLSNAKLVTVKVPRRQHG